MINSGPLDIDDAGNDTLKMSGDNFGYKFYNKTVVKTSSIKFSLLQRKTKDSIYSFFTIISLPHPGNSDIDRTRNWLTATVAPTTSSSTPSSAATKRINSSSTPARNPISVANPPDYVSVPKFTLKRTDMRTDGLTETDMSFEPKMATAILAILLTDVKDNPPRFNQSYCTMDS